MKKGILAVMTVAFLLLPQSVLYTAAQNEEPTSFGTELLSEDFELETAEDGTPVIGWNGWEQDQEGTSASTYNSEITIESEGSGKLASIKRTATTATDLGSYFIKKPIDVPEETDLICIRFKTRRLDTNAAGLIMCLYGPNAAGTGIAKSNTYLYMNAGNGYLWWKNLAGSADYRYALSGGTAIGAVGKWYDVEIRVDYNKKQMEAYIGGVYAGMAPLDTEFSNIYGMPTAISFGTQRIANYWGGMADKSKDAEFQLDDILVTAYRGNLAYSSPADGEAGVDTDTGSICLIFNHEIADMDSAAFTLVSEDGGEAPNVASVLYDGENRRKVTLALEGRFEYGKRYTLSATGVKDDYGREMPAELTFTARERRLTFHAPEFIKDGAALASLEDGDITVKTKIVNEFPETKKMALIAASFSKNGAIKDVAYELLTLEEDRAVEAELTLTADADGRISVLAVDDFSSLSPLTGEYIFHSDGLDAGGSVSAAQAAHMMVSVDYDGSGAVTVSGDAGEGSVIILVLRPGCTKESLTAENADHAGRMIEYVGLADGEAFSKTYVPSAPIDSINPYQAYVSGMSKAVSFRVFDEQSVSKVLNAVKNSTKDTLCAMLRQENPVLLDGVLRINDLLALDLTKYDTLLEPELVTAVLAGQNFETLSALRARYDTALAEALEYEKDGKELVLAVDRALWSELEQLLKKNDAVLKLDWTSDYKKIKNTDMFYKRLANDYTFTTEGSTITKAIESIRKAFATLAEDEWKKEGENTGTGGGSHGGGSSSSGRTDLKLPAQEVTLPDLNTFNDIDGVPWAKEAIEALFRKNIVNGLDDHTFNPNGLVTREQFVKMLVLAFNLPLQASEASFSDVTAQDWYYYYVHTACNQGIVQDDENFGAGRFITRAEMAAMCYRAMKAAGMEIDGAAEPGFADSFAIPEYAKEAVAALAQAGIINGVDENCFAPGESSSRAQAAKIIYGILRCKGEIQ